MNRSKIWMALALAVIVAAVSAVVLVVRHRVPADAAFVYGDRVVTKTELTKRIESLRALYGITEPKNAKGRDGFYRSAAKSYAVTLILDQKAKENGVVISDKKARDLLDKFIDAQFGNRSTFIEVLGNVGTSEPAVLEEIRRQAATIELHKRIVGDVKISNDYLKAAFQRRKAELATPEQRDLANIVVATRAEAVDVAKQLEAGGSAKALAAEVSIDESTRESGGELGFHTQGELESKVGAAAFGVRKGQVYGPAKGSHGWNVGVVEDIRGPQPADFATVAETFRAQLKREREASKWSGWLTQAIHDAHVRYADDYRPADPDAPPPSEPLPKENQR